MSTERQGTRKTADVDFEISHGLGQEEAATRLETLLGSLASGNDLIRDAAYKRQGNEFRFEASIKGFAVKGKATAFDEKVRVMVDLPWAAQLFKGTARDHVRKYLTEGLA